ncbi:hypothetical protein CW304_14410 [Bacillus sp. UFRGS-B20]|nr:hypothetical protein CW304_14410 [Bacillus sp. UFRGS-B20]
MPPVLNKNVTSANLHIIKLFLPLLNFLGDFLLLLFFNSVCWFFLSSLVFVVTQKSSFSYLPPVSNRIISYIFSIFFLVNDSIESLNPCGLASSISLPFVPFLAHSGYC